MWFLRGLVFSVICSVVNVFISMTVAKWINPELVVEIGKLACYGAIIALVLALFLTAHDGGNEVDFRGNVIVLTAVTTLTLTMFQVAGFLLHHFCRC